MNDIEMEDPTESDDFHLSRVIDAHKADVKCITSTSAGVLISGGRDENEANRKAPAAVLTAFDDAVAAKVAKELERKEQQEAVDMFLASRPKHLRQLRLQIRSREPGDMYLETLEMPQLQLAATHIRALEGWYKPGSVSGDLIPNACLPQDKKKPRGELVPMSQYYRFGVEQLSTKAHAKLVELNENQPVLRLSDVQVSAIKQLMSPGSHVIEYDVVAAALDVGLQWAMCDLVPILDAFRVALLHERLNTFFCDMKGRGESTQQRLCALLLSEAPDAVCILVCRSLANAFIHPCGREMLCHDFQNLFAVVVNQLKSNKAALQVGVSAMQLAAASTLANWSLLLLNRSETVAELGPREDAIRGIVKVCENIDSFGYLSRDSMIRLLQAIVTFMWGDTSVISLAKSRNMLQIVSRMKDAVVDEQGKNIARDIAEMIYAI
ncbi:PUL domain protein [Teladorsagia circumcincta]|uniref:PUL domain protein n=1 Tax=Teladorsagia circumcincta TaxID=45464 RepID=A0A2G9TXZ1_TELCI|nr:PUL domain protein [Teladorsagia circumcincta]